MYTPPKVRHVIGTFTVWLFHWALCKPCSHKYSCQLAMQNSTVVYCTSTAFIIAFLQNQFMQDHTFRGRLTRQILALTTPVCLVPLSTLTAAFETFFSAEITITPVQSKPPYAVPLFHSPILLISSDCSPTRCDISWWMSRKSTMSLGGGRTQLKWLTLLP